MRVHWLFCSVGGMFKLSIILLEDIFVIPGKNDVVGRGQMGTQLLNYTVKGLLAPSGALIAIPTSSI